jgi:ribokinase
LARQVGTQGDLNVARVLVVGSVAWDEVVRLDTALRVGSHNSGRRGGKRIGGGAANTAMALARAGDTAAVVSAVGEDADGKRLVAELADLGVDVRLVRRHAGETTRSLILLEAGGERTVVNLARATVSVPPHLAEISTDCWYVRSADPALTPLLAQRVRTGLVVAHIPPVGGGLRPARVLVGSASDLGAAFLADPYAAGRHVAGDLLEWTVVTLGPEGAAAYGDGMRLEEKAPVVRAADSTGAGDVFAAGLVHALAAGRDMRSALRTAVAWGSASVRYEGTVPPEDFLALAGAGDP